jgi:hypothetical protein
MKNRLALILLLGTIILIITLIRVAPETAFAPGEDDDSATIEITTEL